MNIHEHQAKELLKEFGAPVTNGFVIFKKFNQLFKTRQTKKNIDNSLSFYFNNFG